MFGKYPSLRVFCCANAVCVMLALNSIMPTTKTTDTASNGLFPIVGFLVFVVDIFSIQHIAMGHILLLLNMRYITFMRRNGIEMPQRRRFNIRFIDVLKYV